MPLHQHHCVAKCASSRLGYAPTVELAHVVYDLNLWTARGAKKNLGAGVPMRFLLASHSFPPPLVLWSLLGILYVPLNSVA